MEIKMFTTENTTGFTADDLSLMNLALEILINDGMDEKNAIDHINNRWRENGNTIATLTA